MCFWLIDTDFVCSANGVIHHVDSPASDSAIVLESYSNSVSRCQKNIHDDYLIGGDSLPLVERYMKEYERTIDFL